MDNKLTIQDLASAFVERYGMEAHAAESFINTVFEIIQEYIFRDKVVRVKGLGTFKLVSVSQRESISVKTGERILIAGHSKLSFTPDTALKDIVNRPFADFETIVLKDTTSITDMERITPDEADVPANEDKAPDSNANNETTDELKNTAQAEAASDEDAPLPDNDEAPAVSDAPGAEIQSQSVIDEAESTTHTDEIPQAAEEESERTEEDSERTEEAEILNTDTAAQEPIVLEAAAAADTHSEASEEAVFVEISDVQCHPVAEKENLYPMASAEITRSSQESSSSVRKWVYAVLTIILMAISYIGGHHHWLGNVDIKLYPEEEIAENSIALQKPVSTEQYRISPVMADSTTLSADTISQDTISQDTIAAQKDTILAHAETPSQISSVTPAEDPAEIAKYFPQVKNGSYWIVGDAGRIHYMEAGETLYRVAKKELGDQDLVRYIIIFNDFEDPNLIHTGDPIRIPKLVKK